MTLKLKPKPLPSQLMT